MQVTLEKIMFEIYKDSSREGEYKVIYFTELDEHSKQTEINSAMRGEHLYDGFIRYNSRDEGKRAVNLILKRLNEGEWLDSQAIERELKSFMA
ncbi:MAG: hypothetical protein JWN45_3316 [Acidobacteriaceae bacterium]|nr:hypothetical protein [Acidobacteriaceae bacterium]